MTVRFVSCLALECLFPRIDLVQMDADCGMGWAIRLRNTAGGNGRSTGLPTYRHRPVAAMGVPARRVEHASEIAPAIEAGIAFGAPNLIEIAVGAT